jgi:hypothetical protein
VQDAFAVCMNFCMRQSPGVKNNILTILVATASLLALAQAAQCDVSEEMARGLDGRVVLREK